MTIKDDPSMFQKIHYDIISTLKPTICRFQCGNCVIMPTDHECICCCEVERVSEDHVSPGCVVLGLAVPPDV